jgi:hypothetical protein
VEELGFNLQDKMEMDDEIEDDREPDIEIYCISQRGDKSFSVTDRECLPPLVHVP